MAPSGWKRPGLWRRARMKRLGSTQPPEASTGVLKHDTESGERLVRENHLVLSHSHDRAAEDASPTSESDPHLDSVGDVQHLDRARGGPKGELGCARRSARPEAERSGQRRGKEDLRSRGLEAGVRQGDRWLRHAARRPRGRGDHNGQPYGHKLGPPRRDSARVGLPGAIGLEPHVAEPPRDGAEAKMARSFALGLQTHRAQTDCGASSRRRTRSLAHATRIARRTTRFSCRTGRSRGSGPADEALPLPQPTRPRTWAP